MDVKVRFVLLLVCLSISGFNPVSSQLWGCGIPWLGRSVYGAYWGAYPWNAVNTSAYNPYRAYSNAFYNPVFNNTVYPATNMRQVNGGFTQSDQDRAWYRAQGVDPDSFGTNGSYNGGRFRTPRVAGIPAAWRAANPSTVTATGQRRFFDG